MPSKKIEQALEYAAVAQQMAANAMVSVYAQGVILETLIGTLRDENILTKEKIQKVFWMAAGIIDAQEPADDIQKESARGMREIVQRIANGFGVSLPPPGQIPMHRKH